MATDRRCDRKTASLVERRARRRGQTPAELIHGAALGTIQSEENAGPRRRAHETREALIERVKGTPTAPSGPAGDEVRALLLAWHAWQSTRPSRSR